MNLYKAQGITELKQPLSRSVDRCIQIEYIRHMMDETTGWRGAFYSEEGHALDNS